MSLSISYRGKIWFIILFLVPQNTNTVKYVYFIVECSKMFTLKNNYSISPEIWFFFIDKISKKYIWHALFSPLFFWLYHCMNNWKWHVSVREPLWNNSLLRNDGCFSSICFGDIVNKIFMYLFGTIYSQYWI